MLPNASKPSFVTRSRKAAPFAISASALLSLSTTSRGVPAGANTPFHEVMSKPLSSGVSASGGSSGKSLVRSCVVTAMARILPALTVASPAARSTTIIDTCPPMRSAMAGGVLL
ncbi:hypothetical protein FQZ97_683540 [compost metagenome]